MNASRRMVIITDGYNDPHTAKTAICVIRYRPEEVVAVLDRQSAGKTAGKCLAWAGAIPVRRRAGRRPRGQHAADRHRAAGRKNPAPLAADRPGGHRAEA